MENYRNELTTQLKEIERLIEKSGRGLQKHKHDLDCSVKVSRSNGCYQYYISEKKGAGYKYARNSDQKRVKDIVQRTYEEAVNSKLRELGDGLREFLMSYDFRRIDEVYKKMPEGKRRLVIPIVESEDQLIERWIEEHPGNKNAYHEKGKILTDNGEMVRSKSEKIIADMLKKNHVPYQYETKLELGNFHTVYPDFAVLNVRLAQTVYWEHFGLMSDPEYAVRSFRKIMEYERAGYRLGDNFIFTMESPDEPIDVKQIEKKIYDHCM